jgi:glucose/arabinose dehydrogenase
MLAGALLQVVLVGLPLPPVAAATRSATNGVSAVAAAPPAKQSKAPCQHGFLSRSKPTTSPDCTPTTPTGTTNGTTGPQALAATLPTGFQDSAVLSGLTNPTVVQFASDGRVFVGEKSGTIKIYPNLSSSTPEVYTGLTTNVQNYWDRGLLGMALDPFITNGSGGNGSFIYVLYTYDHILGTGGGAPTWGDTCPTPPGPTTDGCVVSARLSRFAVSGTTITGAEQVLIEDWCQQFPSHSIGTLLFGPDGMLYVSGGEGANFDVVDYGQFGGSTTPVVTPLNPCGDPPQDAMTPPTAEGGALRSQDVRSTPLTGSYLATVTADHPIAYWRLGENSGTTAIDQTGAHPGSYTGGATFGVAGALTGDANTAVTLNGTSQYVSVSDSSAFRFSGTSPFSAEIWFKHTPDATYRRIFSAENAAGQGWQVYSQNGSFGFLRNPNEIGSGVPIASGWHHFVATYDGSTMHAYLDGGEFGGSGVTATNAMPSDSTFFIGRYGGANVSQFNGSVDEAAIYNYALTPAQVFGHYLAGVAPGSGGGGDPTGLDGAIERVDPNTGAGAPGNPFAASPDPNSRRIIAFGLRNPFRMTARPGTNELWVGDVGWGTWEEINRIADMTDSTAENFGWPCYEGVPTQSGYDGANLSLCESLYAQGPGAVTAPIFAYNHTANVVAGDNCPPGSSSISGLAFYPDTGGTYPAAYRGGLFFTDHSRNCIWFMAKNSSGQIDTNSRQLFIGGAINPVDLKIGPAGDLFYVDFDGGTIHRVTFSSGNLPPTAVIQAVPTSGAAPLTVQFSGTGSSDPEGGALTYAWDLNGDGIYDDATGVTAQWTYPNAGNVTVSLRVTDPGGATGTASQLINVGNSPPTPVIDSPSASTTWKVGDQINFSGHATDPQDGTLPPSALTWTLTLYHCPSNCHTHDQGSWVGVSSGSFVTPDHEYPSYLLLTLTATDSQGLTASTSVQLNPQTVVLSFQSAPAGLSLAVNAASSVTPFTRTVIVNSMNSVTATSPQALNGLTYNYSSWSDALSQSHTIVAPATPTTYTATYVTTAFVVNPTADAYIRWNKTSTNFGTATNLLVRSGQYRTYLKFTVTGLAAPPQNAKLRLWVTGTGTSGGSIYQLSNTSWTETGITWGNAPPISGSPLAVAGAATAGTWLEFDLGTVITGNGTYTFAISGGNTDQVSYASRETSTTKPQLVVTR